MKALRRWLQASFVGRIVARRTISSLARHELESGEPELRIVPLLCRPDRASVDVGANRGVYAYTAIRWSSHVVAIEPNPVLASFIRRWAGGKVRVVEAAVSSHTGSAALQIPINDGSEWDGLSSLRLSAGLRELPSRMLQVATVRLDDLDLPPTGFIKIDVEGFESEVVAGAMDLITKDRPTLLIEAEERHSAGSLENISVTLAALGYRGFFIDGARLISVDEFHQATHQNPSSVELSRKVAGKQYINNFVFIPSELCAILVGNIKTFLVRR